MESLRRDDLPISFWEGRAKSKAPYLLTVGEGGKGMIQVFHARKQLCVLLSCIEAFIFLYRFEFPSLICV